MHSQPTPKPLTVTASGVCVVDGYGIEVKVERGHLIIADGIGPLRRRSRFSRATSRLRRLVLIGHTGFVTLDAMRWLADVGVSFVQLDPDGRLLVASGGLGRDDPRLRRAQALAIDTAVGQDVARRLLAEKVAGQAETLARHPSQIRPTVSTVAEMARAAAQLHVATSRDELRLAEAQAALAYWAAWTDVTVRFTRRDAPRVPAKWLTFGVRRSPLTGNPRLAANPANAILNYLYAILESEARIACLAIGLDPGLGVLHADLKARDSLALDVIEAVRPQVDAYVLEILEQQVFRAADFHETRQGACRLLEPMTHQLAETGPVWSRSLGPVVEQVAKFILEGSDRLHRGSPTPLTGANRSAGRRGPEAFHPRPPVGRPRPAKRRASHCERCGAPVTNAGRKLCGACWSSAIDGQRRDFAAAGAARLTALRAAGQKPGIGGRPGWSAAQRSKQHSSRTASGSGRTPQAPRCLRLRMRCFLPWQD